ncbi:MAG: DNA/RNA non-specific endonuclease [Lewinella sp.]|nr:DNA/RNA non-specific endonuclease [Lewinella sp.]
MSYRLFLAGLLLSTTLTAQPISDRIADTQAALAQLDLERQRLEDNLESLQLAKIQDDLSAIGLPGEAVVRHEALALEYDEAHEQARWVAHIILPDVINGNVARTNDFRPDPLVASGSAVEADYFLKYLQPDSTYQYDGYGYDRGHLAPSADFRWSERALSASYLYSNMSPQLPDFNREGWAELEGQIRAYIFDHPETQLYVVTGPVLTDDLPKVERSPNGVSIPRTFYKVVLDLTNGRGIGFLIPHGPVDQSLETYAVSIDAVEEATGLDFFNKLPDEQEARLEGQLNKVDWFPNLAAGDVESIYPPDLQPGFFSVTQVRQHTGSGNVVRVCGTVVGTHVSRSGNVWLNIDKQYPNQLFSVFIRKEDLVNFGYNPETTLVNRQLCFEGEVSDYNGTPTMNIEREEAVYWEVPMRE